MNRACERDESTSSSGNVSVASVGGGRSKRNKNQSAKPPNPVTVEKVRMIMEQEGRSARNLVSWSIPLDTNVNTKSKVAKSARNRSQSKRAQSCESALRKLGPESKDSYSTRSFSGERKKQKNTQTESLIRQATSGAKKNVSIRARYWAYLFENLRRAVDEIYTTCEADASVMECKEMLLVLDNYRHEFQALINWINLQERLENAGIHDRPTSLAWEVRKSSPGRPRQKTAPKMPDAASSNKIPVADAKISRLLNFSKAVDVASLSATGHSTVCVNSTIEPVEGTNEMHGAAKMESVTVTWADRVKGVAPAPVDVKNSPVTAEASENIMRNGDCIELDLDDDDGGEWETVSSRTRQSKHSKAAKHDAQVLKSIGNTPPQTHVKPVRSTPEKMPQKPDSGFVNLVVDHLIASGQDIDLHAGSKRTSAPACQTLDLTPVQFMNDRDAIESDKFQHGGESEKLTFEGDAAKCQDEGLRDLDAAEAEFFKTVEEENAKQTGAEAHDQLRSLEAQPKTVPGHDAVTMEQLKQHDESIAAAEEQERDLRRQILEVQESKSEGRDTPEIETDIESARSSMGAKDIGQLDKSNNGPLEWSEFLARFDHTDKGRQSWCDLVEEEELREPGRAGQMHEKLSSPSRKRTPAESKRKLEEKHRKAEARRLQMQEEKTQRIHELTEKVQEVVSWKNELIQKQKILLQSYHDEKLARAEEMRAMQLLNIKRKAQAEDTKVSEIAFINELQEQNKRHEVLMRIGEHEARIQEMEIERSKMMEMKSAKEETFKERRRALEKERQERIEELKVKRKEQDARIEQQRIEKEKEREKIAKERARDRELRLSARNAAQQEAVTELQKKIQLKHDESERRHQEQLEHRKEKAVELSLGRFSTSNPAATLPIATATITNNAGASRMSAGTSDGDATLAVCGEDNIAAQNDKTQRPPVDAKGDAVETSSASRGSANTSPRSHSDECKALKEEAERLKERHRTMRKRAKKLRVRMSARAKEFLKRVELKNVAPNGTNKVKVVRLIKDVNRQLTNQKGSSGPWPANRVAALDRTLGEIVRCLEKEKDVDQSAFRVGGGFEMLDAMFEIYLRDDTNDELPPVLPDRLLGNAASCFRLACAGNHDNCVYAVCSNRVVIVVDVLLQQISKNDFGDASKSSGTRAANPAPSQSKKATSSSKCEGFDAASPALLRALAITLNMMADNPPSTESISNKGKSFAQMICAPNSDHRKILEAYLNRGLDVISYIVASRVLDVLGQCLSNVRHEVAPGSNLAAFVESGLAFLESATSFVTMRNRLSTENHAPPCKPKTTTNGTKEARDSSVSPANHWDHDPTQLLPTLQHTELMGIVSVLYGLLLHGAPERPTALRSACDDEQQTSSASREQIPAQTLSVALAVMKVLNAVAEMDLRLLQASLGAEGVSLEYRHICTYLLWYCVQGEHTDLLHAVIVSVGHFTLDNRNNQNIVDSGAQPTVLQQLCLLPFAYFSSSQPMRVLLPTLIACCHGNPANLSIMEQEASASLLVNFIQTLVEVKEKSGTDKGAKNKKNGQVQETGRRTSLADHPLFTGDYLQRCLCFFTGKQS